MSNTRRVGELIALLCVTQLSLIGCSGVATTANNGAASTGAAQSSGSSPTTSGSTTGATGTTGSTTSSSSDGSSGTGSSGNSGTPSGSTSNTGGNSNTGSGTTGSNGSSNGSNPPTSGSSSSATGGNVSLSASSYSANQRTGALLFTAQRAGSTTGTVSINYSTHNGTAIAGSDYTATQGTITWDAGDASIKSISVPVSANSTFSGTKSFSVVLSNPSQSLALAGTDRATATIVGAGTSPSVAAGTISKSIKEWVSCDGQSDDTVSVAKAFAAAANHAFTLVIDCTVRMHTGAETATTVAIADGTTVVFNGGTLEVLNTGAPAFSIAHPTQVALVDWDITYL